MCSYAAPAPKLAPPLKLRRHADGAGTVAFVTLRRLKKLRRKHKLAPPLKLRRHADGLSVVDIEEHRVEAEKIIVQNIYLQM
jgi:hypothetical protein